MGFSYKVYKFEDLVFKPHPIGNGKIATLNFPNDFGVSVVFGSLFYSNGVDNYELAVLHNGELTYDTEITDDVLGYLSPKEISDVMGEIQKL